MTRHLIASCVCALTTFQAIAGDENEPNALSGVLEPKKYEDGIFDCEVSVRVDPQVVATGGTFRLECEARCTDGSRTLFNPFLSERHKLPARIIITSVDGSVRREVLRPSKADLLAPNDSKWVRPLAWRALGREFSFTIAGPSDVELNATPYLRSIDLPPGEYLVQAIYNHWLVAFWPNNPMGARQLPENRNGDDPQPFPPRSAAEMDLPLAVSAPAKLVVTSEVRRPSTNQASNDSPIYAELRPHRIASKPGRLTQLEIRIVNQSERTIDIFNPMLDRSLFLYNRSTLLEITTNDGRRIGDLLRIDEGSFRGLMTSDWQSVPPGGTISTMLKFSAGDVPGTRYFGPNKLSPSTYLIQLHIHGHATRRPPFGLPGAKDDPNQRGNQVSIPDWERTFPGPEICRSNRIELEILPRTGD